MVNHITKDKPDEKTIWQWLENVPDPEVPVVSLVDLGIIRAVNWHDDMLEVIITPTYSGCPATSIIAMDVENALRDNGIDKFEVKRQLSPAWTTDWMSESGKEKLRQYGIAPPVGKISSCNINATDDGLPISFAPSKPIDLPCPRCDSADTRCVSWFGSTACKASYQCNDCLEPFDYFKCI